MLHSESSVPTGPVEPSVDRWVAGGAEHGRARGGGNT
jgi:hypothetical protein